MGEMADFTNDDRMDEVEHYEVHKDSDVQTQYDEGLIDETGATIGNPSTLPFVTHRS